MISPGLQRLVLWRYAETSRQAARSEAIIANDMRETAVAERQKSERSLYFRRIGQAAAEHASEHDRSRPSIAGRMQHGPSPL